MPPPQVDAPPEADRLPRALLHGILRTCGPHTRRVCRHWHGVYGPLTGGLLLTSPQDLTCIPPHLAPTPILAITLTNPATLAALPTSFTHLQSLDLDATPLSEPLPQGPYPPLFPHLTSLTLRSRSRRYFHAPVAALAAALPTLRSLALVTPKPPCQLTALRALSSLSSLRDLSFHCNGCLAYRPNQIFPPPDITTPPDAIAAVAALPPPLTYLDLSAFHLKPTHNGFGFLPPSLRYLFLNLAFNSREHPSHSASGMEALTSVLSQRQALTHLELALTIPSDWLQLSPRGFEHLSRLSNLWGFTLALGMHAPEGHLAAISQAVSLLPSMQRLVLLTTHFQTDFDEATLQRLCTAVTTLTQLRVDCRFPSWAAFASIRHLTLLQQLDLLDHADFNCRDDPDGARSAADAVLALTQLTRLWLLPHHHPAMAHGVLGGISALAKLQQLRLSCPLGGADLPQHLASASSTLTRLDLVPSDWSHTDDGHLCATSQLRGLRDLPGNVRCLVLAGLKIHAGSSSATLPARMSARRAAAMREAETARRLKQDLLPLPGGLRVLALEPDKARELPGTFRSALEAAARAQDCVVLSWLPEDESHFGCNGYS